MATPINNSASATYSYSGRASQDSATSNTTTTNLITEFAISGYKDSLNSSFRAGQNLTYFIYISNDGTSPLYNVTVSDDLGGPGNILTYVTSSAKLNINGTVSDITPTTLTPLSFVIPGVFNTGDKATITYIAQVNSTLPSSIESITNTANIQANEGSTTGNIISVTPSPNLTLPVEDFASITMNKTVSSNTININEPFSYFITLNNSGNLEATNVIIKDVLPTNFVISSITSLSGGIQTTFPSSDYDLDTSTNTLTLPNISSANSITVPAATTTGDGTTIVTINGTITA